MSKEKWVLQLFEIDGSALATGRTNLAVKAAAEIRHGNMGLGNYLQDYNPEAHNGRGDATFTPDVAKAMKFDSFYAAMECWSRQSKTLPLRPDGKPNKPLTAFSVSPKKIEEGQ